MAELAKVALVFQFVAYLAVVSLINGRSAHQRFTWIRSLDSTDEVS